MLTDAVISGICRALDSHFRAQWPGLHIFKEAVPQNLGERAFLVRNLSERTEQIRDTRYSYEGLFEVKYFPASETEAVAECLQVQWPLFWALEVIEVSIGGEPTLKKMTFPQIKIVDGTLLFLPNYDFHFSIVRRRRRMRELNFSINVRPSP